MLPPLGPLGAPGCTAFLDPLVSAAVPLANPVEQVPVPLSASLVGFTMLAQSAALAPAINSLGIVTSNGLRGVVGDV